MDRKTLSALIGLLLLISVLPSFASAADSSEDDSVCAYYYWATGCHYCAKTEPFLDTMEENYPQLELHKFDIREDSDAANDFAGFYDKYGIDVSEGGTPTLVINDEPLIGKTNIERNLEDIIKDHPDGLACPSLEDESAGGGLAAPSILAVLGAAAADAINPCALAVLLLLLITIASAARRGSKKALLAGFSFSAAIFLAYLAMGLGLFTAIQSVGATQYVKYGIGVLAIVVGLFNLKDFFKLGSLGFKMEVPERWRPKMKGLIRKVTSAPGAFVIGLLVSLFLLPCTSGPYVVIIGMLASAGTFWAALPLLLLYNFIFVAPMLALTVFVHLGASAEKINRWRSRKLRWLHLITGLIMVILGVLLLAGVL